MSTQRIRPQVDVVYAGCDRESGVALGANLRDKIHSAFLLLPKLEAFRMHQPWWMPYSMYQRMAQRQALNRLGPGTRQWFPQMADRLTGMAEGAAVTIDSLYLFHMLELSQNPLEQRSETPLLAGCTALAVGKRRSALGEPVVVHNFDMLPLSATSLVLRHAAGAGRYRSIQFTMAPLGGTVDGINEAGLCITYNYAAVCDANLSRPPVSFAVDDALSHCHSVREAVRRIIATPRGNGAILMLADASGDIASLELSGTRAKVRRPRLRRDLLLHTNCFLSRRLRCVEPHRSAVYGVTAPRVLRGRSVFRSPIVRLRRLSKLVRGQKQMSPDDLHRLMSDHGVDGTGTDETICMHDQYWSTLASIQFFPASRRLRVSYQPTCQAEYTDFAL